VTAISPKDASLLALLAERPKRNSAIAKRAFLALGSEAQRIADALRGRRGVSEKADQTAEGLHDWVKTNKVVRKRRK
jgi:hypothetical protein